MQKIAIDLQQIVAICGVWCRDASFPTCWWSMPRKVMQDLVDPCWSSRRNGKLSVRGFRPILMLLRPQIRQKLQIKFPNLVLFWQSSWHHISWTLEPKYQSLFGPITPKSWCHPLWNIASTYNSKAKWASKTSQSSSRWKLPPHSLTSNISNTF